MKTKMLIIAFMLFISFFAKAEKTYRSDHSDCNFKGEKIDLDIRSHQRYSTSEDDEYGDTVLIGHAGKSIKLNLNDNGTGRFRLLKAENEICSKVLALSVKSDEVAFFIMKDNRPFADTVMVLYYNVKTHEADFMPSKIQAKVALYSNGKAYFKLASEDVSKKYGDATIKQIKYTTIEQTLEPWISFDGKNFKLDRQMTYDQFEPKGLLKPSMLVGLNEFKEIKYRIAINPLTKSNCLSFNQGRWICN